MKFYYGVNGLKLRFKKFLEEDISREKMKRSYFDQFHKLENSVKWWKFLNLSCNFTPIACHFSFPLKSETEILLFAFVIFREKTIEEIRENVANIWKEWSKVSGHCFHIFSKSRLNQTKIKIIHVYQGIGKKKKIFKLHFQFLSE